MSDSAFVRNFDQIEPEDRGAVGGKGLQLGFMARAGFPVPVGMVVTTAAFAEFFEATGVGREVARLAATIDYDRAEQVEEVTAAIREAIVGGKIPAAITEQVAVRYAELGDDVLVAVRSSATAEDMPGSSFAGMHDTYLDIRGIDQVFDAVRRCWASGWTARAASYRKAQGFDHDSMLVAVVIQKMVAADVSGVLFTGNPFTHSEREIVINSSWGLGEAIVSGITQPDEFVLDKPTGTVKQRALGPKTVMIVRDESGSGTRQQDVDEERRSRYSLDDGQLTELARLGRRIEDVYLGIPQDIEWAHDEDGFHVLQSRDITAAAFPYEEGVERWQSDVPEDADVIWSRKMADEYYTGPITPLFYSLRAKDTYEGGILSNSESFRYRTKAQSKRHFRWHHGRIFVNSTQHREDIVYWAPPDARPEALQQVPPSMRGDLPSGRQWAGRLLRGYLAHRHAEPERSFRRYVDNCHRIFEASDRALTEMRKTDLSTVPDAELMRRMEELVAMFTEEVRGVSISFLAYIPAVVVPLGRILGFWYGEEPQITLGTLLSGLEPATPTTLDNIAVYELAQQFRRFPGGEDLLAEGHAAELIPALEQRDDGAELLSAYRSFLEERGHRGHADRDIWFARWGDEPEGLHTILRAMLSVDAANDPRAADRRAVQKQKETAEKVRAKLRSQRFGGLRVRLFNFLLSQAHRTLHMRDYERFEVDKISWEKRRVALEIGRRLTERGTLDEIEDVFFLSREEIEEILSEPVPKRLIEAKVRSRRRAVERYREAPAFSYDDRALITEEAAAAETDGSVLAGAGTSPGKVSGTARVIHDLKEIGRLQQGDILVTNSTDPGWTSAFLLIGGLVLETGGMLAHGSVLSREYGLAAVTSIENATGLVPDGATITVDGSAGTVTIEDEAVAPIEKTAVS
jgi:pyruvate,water dikinase